MNNHNACLFQESLHVQNIGYTYCVFDLELKFLSFFFPKILLHSINYTRIVMQHHEHLNQYSVIIFLYVATHDHVGGVPCRNVGVGNAILRVLSSPRTRTNPFPLIKYPSPLSVFIRCLLSLYISSIVEQILSCLAVVFLHLYRQTDKHMSHHS